MTSIDTIQTVLQVASYVVAGASVVGKATQNSKLINASSTLSTLIDLFALTAKRPQSQDNQQQQTPPAQQ